MMYCKEPQCSNFEVVGGYCLLHQTERANDLDAKLSQRNDSGSRMSREITERIANESHLAQRATTAERERDEARAEVARLTAERDEAQDEIERLRNHSARNYYTPKPLDEWKAETPFGQMLDGMGDEVEP